MHTHANSVDGNDPQLEIEGTPPFQTRNFSLMNKKHKQCLIERYNMAS